jgi:CTP synthase (UTP-ammonia lyase)
VRKLHEMAEPLRVALIGDYDPTVIAHQAIPRALALAATALNARVDGCWLATHHIMSAPDALLPAFDAFWCVPASPYRSTEGAPHAIRFAREAKRPFLGTCGGFQHAVLEFARNVAGMTSPAHAELEPAAASPLVSALSCSLVEVTGTIALAAGSRLRACYGREQIVEGYHCSYGLNEQYRATLERAGMRFTGFADDQTVRAFELDQHPFFIGTLFQPERSALRDALSPPVVALLRAALPNAEVPARA